MSAEVLAAPAATVVPSPAQVAPSVVIPVKVAVSDAIVRAFCDAIVDGADTKGIFPDRIANLALSEAQRSEIKAARKDREAVVKADKKNILRWLRHKRVETRGMKQRRNARTGAETMHLRAVKPGAVVAKRK